MYQKIERFQIRIEGFVQGVGFRPFVYRVARALNINGWVKNDTEGVLIEIDTTQNQLNQFLEKIKTEKPNLAKINNIKYVKLFCFEEAENQRISLESDRVKFHSFEIKSSSLTQNFNCSVMSDIATCRDCLEEVMDPKNRRYQYVFTNCTVCGPRASIMDQLPYDRKNTSMKKFTLCKRCQDEYFNPNDRRFHAEPNACMDCGPQISLHKNENELLCNGFQALEKAVHFLNEGHILSIKGMTGYHLVVDAFKTTSIETLRIRKRRKSKPFAVMMSNIEMVERYCDINEIEKKELLSAVAPIVLLKLKKENLNKISNLVAPNNPYLGVLLPHSPLHHWLMKLCNKPLIFTSANFSDDPIVYKEEVVFSKLKTIVDYYLIHSRPILRPMDDSIVQVIGDRVMSLRVGRGLAPLSIPMESSKVLLGVGAHMKNNFALANSNQLLVSQNLGDMESDSAQNLFISEVNEALRFYHLNLNAIICDKHPAYFSSEWGREVSENQNISKVSIQHHRAHIFSTLVENQIRDAFLGVAWDGTGLGDDGTLWGSEFFVNNNNLSPKLNRVAHWKPFLLLGGESSIRSPWKVALSLLFEIDMSLAKDWFLHFQSEKGIETFESLYKIWVNKINSPLCCSAGRMWDGVSALLGLCQESDFEAEAAMLLEFKGAEGKSQFESENFNNPEWRCENSIYQWDWRSWVREVARASLAKDFNSAPWAYQFHLISARSIFEMAKQFNLKNIVLSGGVFQNRLLMELILAHACQNKIEIHLPRKVPVNDGGISVGQIMGSLHLGHEPLI